MESELQRSKGNCEWAEWRLSKEVDLKMVERKRERGCEKGPGLQCDGGQKKM